MLLFFSETLWPVFKVNTPIRLHWHTENSDILTFTRSHKTWIDENSVLWFPSEWSSQQTKGKVALYKQCLSLCVIIYLVIPMYYHLLWLGYGSLVCKYTQIWWTTCSTSLCWFIQWRNVYQAWVYKLLWNNEVFRYLQWFLLSFHIRFFFQNSESWFSNWTLKLYLLKWSCISIAPLWTSPFIFINEYFDSWRNTWVHLGSYMSEDEQEVEAGMPEELRCTFLPNLIN